MSAPRISFLYFTPALGWGIFVAYFTLIPGGDLPNQLRIIDDKLLHFFIFFFAALLIILGFSRFKLNVPISWGQRAIVLFSCVAFGALIEILQFQFISERAGEWADFWANRLGILACLSLSIFFWPLPKAPQQKN
jgi:VanZ family protein